MKSRFAGPRNWLEKICAKWDGRPTPWSYLHYMNPEEEGDMGSYDSLYQSPDFPWVFLGSKDITEFRMAETMARQIPGFENKKMVRVDVTDDSSPTDMPTPIIDLDIHEPDSWTPEMIQEMEPTIQQAIDSLANLIMSKQHPVYVHCTMGANRSVSILTGALARASGREYFDILKEMKNIRGMAAPTDAMVWLTSDPTTRNELNALPQQAIDDEERRMDTLFGVR